MYLISFGLLLPKGDPTILANSITSCHYNSKYPLKTCYLTKLQNGLTLSAQSHNTVENNLTQKGI